MTKIEEKVEALVQKPITDLGYELYDVIYEKEASDYYLRIFIDTPKGISLEDCEKVNDAINDLLDKADYIKEAYYLEVSSPGVESLLRQDKHLKQNIKKKIEINLFSPISLEEYQKSEMTKTIEENKQVDEKKKSKKKNQKENKTKILNGILEGYDDENITIEIENNKISVPRNKISNIKLKYDWN